MKNTIRNVLTLTAAAGLLALGACGHPTEVEEHADVEGFALFEGTAELYRYTLDDGAPPTLPLDTGTHQVTFILLDHDGGFLAEEHGADPDHAEVVLQITIADTGVLTWTPEDPAAGEVHEFVEFHGDLNALTAGSTTMHVCVPHAGHCDFEADVPVSVTAP